MIIVRPQDAVHKSHLLRLLNEILDTPLLANALYFKGGTCASLMGILDRFSVDLDFDIKKDADESILKADFHKVFAKLNFEVKDESQHALQFFLKYPSADNQRNTLKIDALNTPVLANKYAPVFLAELDRIAVCQTKETLFANKLVALLDRYQRSKNIAGRDVYDIHHFFLKGLAYDEAIIQERTKQSTKEFFKTLVAFIQDKISQQVLDQDLNALLPSDSFQRIRKTLKVEVVGLFNQEIAK